LSKNKDFPHHFSSEQAEELVRIHGLKACLSLFYYAARRVNEPGYYLVSEKIVKILDLIRR
jgi:hypothetical protein